MTKKLTETQIRAALKKHGGLQSLAAKTLGVSRQCVHERIQGSPTLQSFLREMDEAMLDTAENTIHKALKKGDKPMTRWFAERKGKARGYATKVETESKLADVELEGLVAAFGGDVERLRRFRNSLDPSQAAKQGPAT